jgi:alkanesulfonate monooxygenase SsuD/methylene tetrahydromethanopterin reductase-like flavin-dependent oxidoreductase (luciferase family)
MLLATQPSHNSGFSARRDRYRRPPGAWSSEALAEVSAARSRGANVFAETCPQYLYLTLEDYDYNQHGQAGNTHAAFVPDEIVDRFCLIGPPERHVERLEELRALGVDQFAVYLQHDGKDQTLAAYGGDIIPALNPAGLAVW